MALEAPLRSSTGNLQFPFAYPQTDMSASTDHESRRSPFRPFSSPPPATDSSSLRPNSVNRMSSSSYNVMSPSDIVGPSPVTSNGTETTEIEDDVLEDLEREVTDRKSTRRSELLMLTTNLPESVRQSSTEEAVSVIHAPESFASWVAPPPTVETKGPSPRTSPKSEVESLSSYNGASEKTSTHPTRPPIMTDVNPVRYSIDSATPRAQDLQSMLDDGARLRSSSTSSLEKIDEQTEAEGDDEDYESEAMQVPQQQDEIETLRDALTECWTLCNSLSKLSSIQRNRGLGKSGIPDAHDKAWRTCWKLCQRLYNSRDEDASNFNVKVNLDLCRDFCQALFEVRQRNDEAADSVLRVSFELNNHLYSAQDMNLPEEFRERTLDFYIALCHRLMKQRSDLAEETDQLLRACWALAEMLFNLRQNRRDGRPPDEELLSSTVQACWELCDVFRDSWAQVRPERGGTPRPGQPFALHLNDQNGRQSRGSNPSSVRSRHDSVKSGRQEEKPRNPVVPETPVTEFEDTPISPQSRSPTMPNILVLGTPSDNSRGRWSSSASNLSSYSKSSTRTSSTATTTAASEDINVTRAKILVLAAAMNLGFNRDSIHDPKAAATALQSFVKDLPPGSFGSLISHSNLLAQYKNSVLTDAIIPRHHTLPARGKRVTAQEMAKSIQMMMKSSQRYAYLRDLFRVVFQFPIEEIETRRNVSIVV
ncbi:unnamed protein product [Fusarium graminearum]|uniref:Chromosome 1, complete genome n=1 Tax=Gibberella zeae (strain ATCC MYA-4620 / CBS 123657 / FGSC 9075 / NRRL 31084 / PH-1) TaxID=229533 RepID=A0A1C3YHX9_GIBZE|nr:unnamed protein product [Fusarium graminearum]CAF3586974.1 unnamed protein product [Fusarium graminearum]CAG1982499.1 unnamed protein product [Fusarium graminearum]SCB64138.1 unnamed protein product [Fusarium graminearum]VTO94366.1 unnamed protein product [Fusarium graminearum]